MSKATDLADAIVDLLNDDDNDFSEEFEATRQAVPISDPLKLQTLTVTVFAGTKSSTRRTRGGFEHTYKPIIAVQKKISQNDDATRKAESDELMLLVDEIEALVEDEERIEAVEESQELSFQGFDEATQDEEVYNSLLLREQGVFAKPIVLQFQD